MAETTTDLKPCPFCGGEATLFLPTRKRWEPHNPRHRLYPMVRCLSCSCDVPGDNGDHLGGSAAAAWNRRKEDDDG